MPWNIWHRMTACLLLCAGMSLTGCCGPSRPEPIRPPASLLREGRRPRPPYRDDFAPPFRSGQPLDDLFMDTLQASHREPRPCPPPRPRAPGRDDSLMPHTGGDGGHTDCGGGE